LKLGAKIFGALSAILILYLLLGLLLPGTWEAEVEVVLEASPSRVFPFLNRTDHWILWNPMPESGSSFIGPEEGVGSGLAWEDPQYGFGEFRILASEQDSVVEYEVQVEGGSLEIRGVVTLTTEGAATALRWTEKGDFGRNPLLGYAARGMAGSQAEAMRSHLATLEALLARPLPGGQEE
jgi:hypothetical protein